MNLRVGGIVTISSNNVTGDRSLCNGVWEVVAVNEGHVKVKNISGGWVPKEGFFILQINEHDFYDGVGLLEGKRRRVEVVDSDTLVRAIELGNIKV